MTLLRRVVLIVLVALLPALAAEIYNQETLREAQQAEVSDDAAREARAVGAELGRVIDAARNALVALAALPEMLSEDRAGCAALLQSIRQRFASVTLLALIGAHDDLVCSSVPGAVASAPPSQWPQVRLVRDRGHFTVTGYLHSAWTNMPQLGTGLPVLVGQNGAGPILIGNIGLTQIARQMQAMAEQEGATISVLDRSGHVLLSVPDGPAMGSLLPQPEWNAVSSVPLRAVLPIAGRPGEPGILAVEAFPDLIVTVRPGATSDGLLRLRGAKRSYAMFAGGLLAALACAVVLARRAIGQPVARILHTITLWRRGAHQPRVPVTDPRSELGRIGGALNDLLVAFERTESELRASKAELERRVEARTRELEAEVREREATQALLQQSQKMEVIGQLTGGVAHDFNNLLTAIIGNLELATGRSADRPEIVRLLANAARAADRGAALTQRMLAFGRRQFLRAQAVDVAALLAGMEDLLARTIGPTVVTTVQVPPDLWPARADPNQLELVILNLGINARDAMPQGGSLTITAHNETVPPAVPHRARLNPGDYVRLAMRDTGTGMDEATLARVLEPFFTTKPAGKGSGLGLSMAHGVAAQLGGGLAIESAPGRGTEVAVWLPREAAAAPKAPEPARPPARPPADPEPASGAAILLVDDDPEVAEITRQFLQEQGLRVRHAATGAAALAEIEAGYRVDLLIADLAMPGMNGVQLAVRARAVLPGLPVLLATGYADSREVDGAAAGYPVLAKPFRAAQLLAAVADLLGPAAPP